MVRINMNELQNGKTWKRKHVAHVLKPLSILMVRVHKYLTPYNSVTLPAFKRFWRNSWWQCSLKLLRSCLNSIISRRILAFALQFTQIISQKFRIISRVWPFSKFAFDYPSVPIWQLSKTVALPSCLLLQSAYTVSLLLKAGLSSSSLRLGKNNKGIWVTFRHIHVCQEKAKNTENIGNTFLANLWNQTLKTTQVIRIKFLLTVRKGQEK